MREFIRPLNKTINGRIQKANLSNFENEIRKYILKSYITNGKAPIIQNLSKQFNFSDAEIILILEKLKHTDIINFRNNQIICSYPFSNKPTDFTVKIENNSTVFALCATDAFGIHFLTQQNCIVESKCPCCQENLNIVLSGGQVTQSNPANIVEFVSLPENCGCTSDSFCPTIKFFCNRDHINLWKIQQDYDFNGEIYELDEVAYHSKKIFSNLLEL